MDAMTMRDYDDDVSCSPCASEEASSPENKEFEEGGGIKPRYRKWALLDKSRRLKASARERKRRHVLNSALERLRKKVPCFDQNPQKLSKIEVLRQAIGYIADLSQCLKTTKSLAMEFLEPPTCLQQQSPNIGSMLYDEPILFADCARQQVPGHATSTFVDCLSPLSTTSQYACFDQTSIEDLDYGINNSELDVYLRGFTHE